MIPILKGGVAISDATNGACPFSAADRGKVVRYLFARNTTAFDAEWSDDGGSHWGVWRAADGPLKLPFQTRKEASAFLFRPYTDGQTITIEGFATESQVIS